MAAFAIDWQGKNRVRGDKLNYELRGSLTFGLLVESRIDWKCETRRGTTTVHMFVLAINSSSPRQPRTAHLRHQSRLNVSRDFYIIHIAQHSYTYRIGVKAVYSLLVTGTVATFERMLLSFEEVANCYAAGYYRTFIYLFTSLIFILHN